MGRETGNGCHFSPIHSKLTVRGCGFSVFSFKGGWALSDTVFYV